jgi:hypothetical protein
LALCASLGRDEDEGAGECADEERDEAALAFAGEFFLEDVDDDAAGQESEEGGEEWIGQGSYGDTVIR